MNRYETIQFIVNFFVFLFGLFLVVLSLIDALWTALWVDGGAGPITDRITNVVWWIMKKLIPKKRNYWLSLAGPVIQTLIAFVWVGLLWIGWVIMFSADKTALLYTRGPEKTPSDLMDRIYFVAYTMSTMGNGDVYPSRDIWELAASFTTFSGMFMMTLVVSFVLSVIGGVTTKRAFASQVTGIAHTPEEFLINSWDGEKFAGLDLFLISVSSQVGKLAEQQLAYPILHRYHAASLVEDSAPAIAVLDDALTLLRFGVQKPYRPKPLMLKSARSTVQTYLKNLASASIYPSNDQPIIPDLNLLRKAGIPVVSDEEFLWSVDNLAYRRKLLFGLVKRNHFRWPK